MNSFKYLLLGATALAVVGYWSMGDKPALVAKENALAYDSAKACIAAGQNDAEVCQAEFDKAKKLHAEVAPRYQSSNQCQNDFGYNRCYRSSSSLWLPFMMGYMLAPRGGIGYVSAPPLYRTAGSPNSFHTASGGRVGAVSATGQTKVAKASARQPTARTRTVARGGFGARAAGRSAGS